MPSCGSITGRGSGGLTVLCHLRAIPPHGDGARDLTVVHYDADFDTAATLLAFQHRWVLPRGSV